MKRRIQRLKHLGIRLKRIRYRKGYGVHSPFAFRLITEIIAESSPYYSYADIENAPSLLGRNKINLSTKVLKLIFRLVNWMQPTSILEIGATSNLEFAATLAKRNAQLIYSETIISTLNTKHLPYDLVFINHDKASETLEKSKEKILQLVHSGSLLVISGIGYSNEMKELWRSIQQDERAGITFDLYEVGLVFFDLEKNKQDYIVNF